MDQDEDKLRTLLIYIGDRLSNDDRVMLTFLLANDVPRRDLDTISRDSRASMNIIWEALLNRQKITPNNVDYLINCFEKIRRIDLAQRLKQYSTAPRAQNPVKNPKSSSSLFTRYDP